MKEYDKEVILLRSKSMASIILNRPKVLNSLNKAMITVLTDYFREALADEECRFILFYGRGGKGFCSGGDIKELTQKVKEKDFDQAKSFFEEEFNLDLMIYNSSKPVIVIADGVTMGGGLGIAAGADIVVATERTRMAMPESRIGFFPDVGATGWLFLNCPPGYPEYLALTGYSMEGRECVRLGLATHFMNSAYIEALINSLREYEPAHETDKELLVLEIKNHLAPFFDFKIRQNPEMDSWVAEYFAGQADLNEILASLSYCSMQTSLCDEVFKSIKERSPTSLVLTLKLLRHNEGRPLPEVFAAELKAAEYIIRRPDYIEGVRARILDKDDMPRWKPDQISQVDLSDLQL